MKSAKKNPLVIRRGNEKNCTIFLFIPTMIMLMIVAGCKPSDSLKELKRFPIEKAEDLKIKKGSHFSDYSLLFDEGLSSDGNGSCRINLQDNPFSPSKGFKRIDILESGDIDAENVRLVWKAKVRESSNFSGTLELSMLVHYPDYEEDKYDT